MIFTEPSPSAGAPIASDFAIVFGRTGWIDPGFQVIFSLPGIVIATIFVSLPFVAREVVPVLREIGDEQEQAAATLGASGWQTFWRVTVPNIKWGLLYGVILATARAMGALATSVRRGALGRLTVERADGTSILGTGDRSNALRHVIHEFMQLFFPGGDLS